MKLFDPKYRTFFEVGRVKSIARTFAILKKIYDRQGKDELEVYKLVTQDLPPVIHAFEEIVNYVEKIVGSEDPEVCIEYMNNYLQPDPCYIEIYGRIMNVERYYDQFEGYKIGDDYSREGEFGKDRVFEKGTNKIVKIYKSKTYNMVSMILDNGKRFLLKDFNPID